ncbi:unnamed protein product [Pleuronectes platessa]|uniref:Ig-like domain-containing protein n=1 Tax=Pleuronectes platessa TaxID=8262 RepID=A0A9N7TPI0_PLEPL|nr:unnamed protein product [Pleuronectes platessa]
MSVTAAASGFVVLLLTVTVVQCENGWDVSYTSTEICAVRGSTVDITCTYTYPSTVNNHDTTVQETFWFIKESNGIHVDLRTDPEYSGRVENLCGNNTCTLRISNLRESDSAVYKFRFTTNQPTGSLTGSAGVTLSVTDLHVQVSRSVQYNSYNLAELRCQSSCRLPDHLNYVWTDPEYSGRVENLCGNNTCTLRISNLTESDSAVYKFRFTTNQNGGSFFGPAGITLNVTDPQLQVHVRRSTANPSSTWTELTCHSRCQLPDHLSYVWYNNNKPVGRKKYFHLRHFNPEDSYHCAIEGQERFPSPTLYYPSDAPKVPIVTVSPSGEIMEGSSVTLTCSSDANPAAKYTWYKRRGYNQVQPLSEETQFVLSYIQSSDSGEYYCTAENELGRSSANIFITVTFLSAAWRSALIGSAAAVFLAVTLLSVFLLIRKKRNSHQSADPGDRLDHSEQRLHNQSEENCDLHYASVHFMKSETDPIYSNVRSAEPSEHKEVEEVSYASVNFNRSAPRTRGQDTGEDPAALYSTVQKPPAV